MLKCAKHWKPLFVLIVFSYPRFAFVACHGDMEHLRGSLLCLLCALDIGGKARGVGLVI